MGMDSAGPQVNDTGTAGVMARPPLLFLAALLRGLASDRLLPWPFAVPGTALVHWMTAGAMSLVGLALAAAGIRHFSRAATPVPTNAPTRVLVTTGIHGWTRNPIYLGMFLVYGAIGIAAKPVDPDPHAASGHHAPPRRGRARGGVPGTALRRCLSGLQGPRAPLAVALGQARGPAGPRLRRPI